MEERRFNDKSELNADPSVLDCGALLSETVGITGEEGTADSAHFGTCADVYETELRFMSMHILVTGS